jgi:DNA polymerase-3 subunit gamma/tau
VAVETFITDLAGYYHSLLLLKAGVTREALLGYPPARFSQAVQQKYDKLRIERAGELLYELYRNIRYSVSPRFELETLVSKLCWLEKWISSIELRDAVAKTRELLTSRHSLDEGPKGNDNAGSLTEEFKRHMAAKENSVLKEPPKETANYDPAVQTVLSVFNGTIVEENRE